MPWTSKGNDEGGGASEKPKLGPGTYLLTFTDYKRVETKDGRDLSICVFSNDDGEAAWFIPFQPGGRPVDNQVFKWDIVASALDCPSEEHWTVPYEKRREVSWSRDMLARYKGREVIAEVGLYNGKPDLKYLRSPRRYPDQVPEGASEAQAASGGGDRFETEDVPF